MQNDRHLKDNGSKTDEEDIENECKNKREQTKKSYKDLAKDLEGFNEVSML